MGVVRREGDWRLEKRDEGVYEVTHREEVELKVLTPDYQPEVTDISAVDVVPVEEAGSYAEVEALFEERASGGPPDEAEPPTSGIVSSLPDDRARSTGSSVPRATGPGRSRSAGSRVSRSTGSTLARGTGGDDGRWRLPPGGFALVFLLAGALFVASAGFALDSAAFLFGALLALGGVAILGWAAVLYRTRGHAAARAFLTSDAGAAEGEWTLDRG